MNMEEKQMDKDKIELDGNKVLFNWVKTIYGKRCPEIEEGCACCIAWNLYDRLVQDTELKL